MARVSAQRVLRLLPVLLWGIVHLGMAQVLTISDSTKPLASPDASRVIVVDRIFRVIDGEPERYPSRLLVRITDAGGTVTRQRRIDASQVRLLNPPRWIDNRWAAFTYNISKNANGVVYVDTQTAEALQIEFVELRRRMAATETIEVELTSFEVTEYGQQVVRVSNITRRNRSVFPLFLRPLPPYDTSPFPWVFAEQVRTAMRAYHDFLTHRGIRSLRTEEASESFAPEDKSMAALACSDNRPIALICPMEAESPAAALARVVIFQLDPDIDLTCAADLPTSPADTPTSSTISEDTEKLGRFGEYRFCTTWRDENTALVEQEFFESEEQEPHREPLYALHPDGKMEKLAAPKKPEASDTTGTVEADAASDSDADTTAPQGATTSANDATTSALAPTPTTAPRDATTSVAQATRKPPATPATRKPTATARARSTTAKKPARSSPSPRPRSTPQARRSSR
jgi:hypothetical protein